MAFFKATIEVLVSADSEAEACDAIAGGLRPLLKAYADEPTWTNWIDWRYLEPYEENYPKPHNGSGFEHTY